MPVFCKNEPNNPSLIVYTYYIVLYYLYIFNSDPSNFNRLGSSVSRTLASKLDGPRGPWFDPCHRRESFQKLSDFFLISKGIGSYAV